MVECQLPKLDVAGSTPVSRSNFSKTYEPPPNPVLDLCSIQFTASDFSN